MMLVFLFVSRHDAQSPDFILAAFDLVRLVSLAIRSHTSLAAENLFLLRQLALFQERKVKPQRADDAARWLMARLAECSSAAMRWCVSSQIR